MSPAERVEAISQRLQTTFNPSEFELIDDSHKHAGHASAGGAGHYTVRIRSSAFNGKSSLQKHRLVFKALDDLMTTEIHALVIDAKAED